MCQLWLFFNFWLVIEIFFKIVAAYKALYDHTVFETIVYLLKTNKPKKLNNFSDVYDNDLVFEHEFHVIKNDEWRHYTL